LWPRLKSWLRHLLRHPADPKAAIPNRKSRLPDSRCLRTATGNGQKR